MEFYKNHYCDVFRNNKNLIKVIRYLTKEILCTSNYKIDENKNWITQI